LINIRNNNNVVEATIRNIANNNQVQENDMIIKGVDGEWKIQNNILYGDIQLKFGSYKN